MPTSVEEVAIKITARNDARAALRAAQADLNAVGKEAVAAAERATKANEKAAAAQKRAYADAQGTVRQFQSSLNRTVDRGLIGLGALTGGAVALGLKTASSFQRSQAAFGTLLGSVDKGNDLFRQLQAYNLNAAFDLSGIADSTQTLLQFGIAGDKVLPVLKGLGDVAALTNDPTNNLKSMAIALGQISSAGVIRAQDLNQLVQAGFPAYKLLSDISGKTSAQLRKDMETGLTLPADKFVDAVASMQSKTLQVYKGAAQAQNATLTGQWSNFKDTLAQNLAAGLKPAIPQITAELPVLAQSLADAITQITPQLPKLIDSLIQLAPVAVDLAGGFAKMVTWVSPLARGLADLAGPKGIEGLLLALVGVRIASGIRSVLELAAAFRTLAAGEAAASAAGAAGGAGGAAAAGGGLLARLAPLAAPAGVAAGAVAGSALVIGAAGYEGYHQNAINSPTANPGAQAAIAASNESIRNPLGKYGAQSQNALDATVHNYQPTIVVHNPASNVDVAQATHDGFIRAFTQQREQRR